MPSSALQLPAEPTGYRSGVVPGNVPPSRQAQEAGLPERCDSCGEADAGALALVQRVYLTPERWDAPGSIEAGGWEWWCGVCRLHYPHHETSDTGTGG